MRRSTEARLRSTFATVLATMAGTAACGGTTDTIGGGGGGPTPTFTSICSAPRTSTAAGLTASPALDGIVQRTETAFVEGFTDTAEVAQEAGDAWTAQPGETVGSLCKTASNRDACLAKVQGFRFLPVSRADCIAKYPMQGYGTPPLACGATYYLYTRGDQIGVAQSKEEVKALMGTIDTLEEALYIAGSEGYSPNCGNRSDIAESQYRTTADGGWAMTLVQGQSCGSPVYVVEVYIDYAGKLSVVTKEQAATESNCPVAGRRPAGFRVASEGAGIGAHFASMSRLEAASVVAFRRLHRQLTAFGAPPALLDRIRKAARDEIRHARATRALARKYGVNPGAPAIASIAGMPSLFEIAIENAREGCVRETFGALVAHLQAERAGDADVRACMAEIAGEETEHAALSWDIAAWLESQLGAAERQQLAEERQRAFDTLASELASPMESGIVAAAGFPNEAEATRMLEGLAPFMLAA